MATLDATTLGDTYKVPVNGIRTMTGSATICSGLQAPTASQPLSGSAHDCD